MEVTLRKKSINTVTASVLLVINRKLYMNTNFFQTKIS